MLIAQIARVTSYKAPVPPPHLSIPKMLNPKMKVSSYAIIFSSSKSKKKSLLKYYTPPKKEEKKFNN